MGNISNVEDGKWKMQLQLPHSNCTMNDVDNDDDGDMAGRWGKGAIRGVRNGWMVGWLGAADTGVKSRT